MSCPGALCRAPALCLGSRRTLCRGPVLSRCLCVVSGLCRAPPVSRRLCRASAPYRSCRSRAPALPYATHLCATCAAASGPAATQLRLSRARIDLRATHRFQRTPVPICTSQLQPSRPACHPYGSRAPSSDPRATHPVCGAPAHIRVPQPGAFPFSRREPRTLLFGG